MTETPKWFLPLAILALLWNLLGCLAYLNDVRLTPEDVAALPEAMQKMYAARTVWSVSATAIAVWGGAMGCLLLILRLRWATPFLIASLAGLIVQDFGLLVLSGVGLRADLVVPQGIVLLIALGLVMLSRKATAEQWMR